jgi:hypothetical protein
VSGDAQIGPCARTARALKTCLTVKELMVRELTVKDLMTRAPVIDLLYADQT